MLASNSKKGSKTQDGVVGLDVQAAGRDRIIAAACNRTRRSACTQICRAAVTSHPASRFSRCTLITPTREREREKERREESRAGIAFYTPTYTRMQLAVSRLLIVYHLCESKYTRICVL